MAPVFNFHKDFTERRLKIEIFVVPGTNQMENYFSDHLTHLLQEGRMNPFTQRN